MRRKGEGLGGDLFVASFSTPWPSASICLGSPLTFTKGVKHGKNVL
jgi:hypothetical protein